MDRASDKTGKTNTEKRKPKNPITFNIVLNEEQKAAKAEILNNPITLLKGQAGSGKTLLACQIALDLFYTRQVEKIVITRPAVAAGDDIGFLPGPMADKMLPWLAPIYANLYMLYKKELIDKLVEEQNIEILPLSYVRGRTFVNACIIVDESQNVKLKQTEAFIGRLGKESRMIFCGDTSQVDLCKRSESGIDVFDILEKRVKGVKVVTLLKNHRHPIVPEVLDVFRELEISAEKK